TTTLRALSVKRSNTRSLLGLAGQSYHRAVLVPRTVSRALDGDTIGANGGPPKSRLHTESMDPAGACRRQTARGVHGGRSVSDQDRPAPAHRGRQALPAAAGAASRRVR